MVFSFISESIFLCTFMKNWFSLCVFWRFSSGQNVFFVIPSKLVSGDVLEAGVVGASMEAL